MWVCDGSLPRDLSTFDLQNRKWIFFHLMNFSCKMLVFIDVMKINSSIFSEEKVWVIISSYERVISFYPVNMFQFFYVNEKRRLMIIHLKIGKRQERPTFRDYNRSLSGDTGYLVLNLLMVQGSTIHFSSSHSP